MTRFLFDLHNDLDAIDVEGRELPNLTAAKAIGLREAREMICVSVHEGKLDLSHRIQVRDETDETVLVIHFGDVLAVDLQNSMLKVADHSVQMLTPGTVAMIPREAVVQLTLARPKVGHAMWIDTLVDASIFGEWIANVGRRDAVTRMAHLLCEFALRLRSAGLGDAAGYELPMTQEQLADTTGMTAVHVNRTLKVLTAEGLIDRPSPRAVRIADWRKHADAGDFDSNYLHMRDDDPAFA